jgi:hypothetical protein
VCVLVASLILVCNANFILFLTGNSKVRMTDFSGSEAHLPNWMESFHEMLSVESEFDHSSRVRELFPHILLA